MNQEAEEGVQGISQSLLPVVYLCPYKKSLLFPFMFGYGSELQCLSKSLDVDLKILSFKWKLSFGVYTKE